MANAFNYKGEKEPGMAALEDERLLLNDLLKKFHYNDVEKKWMKKQISKIEKRIKELIAIKEEAGK